MKLELPPARVDTTVWEAERHATQYQRREERRVRFKAAWARLVHTRFRRLLLTMTLWTAELFLFAWLFHYGLDHSGPADTVIWHWHYVPMGLSLLVWGVISVATGLSFIEDGTSGL